MRGLWKYTLKSGALQFTLFISVIVALLLAGVLLLLYTHKHFTQQSKFIIDNIKLTESGTIALLQYKQISPDTLTLIIPDADENQDVKMHLSHWGVFEKAFVRSNNHKKNFSRCSFIGTGRDAEKRPALYLKETYMPLVVVGSSKIVGKAYLPEQGVRSGNINGYSYYGNQLIYGFTENSTLELPKLAYNYKELLRYYLYDFTPISPSSYLELIPQKKQVTSFIDKSAVLFSENEIVLKDISLYGNIIIRSSKKITVKATSDLKDIILAAPEIIIENGVNGNFQAIADNLIKVGEKCKLNYPTALVLIEKEVAHPPVSDLSHNKIFICESSTIKGSVCFFSNDYNKKNNYNINILLSKNSFIEGEVYCEGNFELKGSVKGTVYTDQFIANESGTIFVNHIYNGKVSASELPEAFGGILFENEEKTVVKWLY